MITDDKLILDTGGTAVGTSRASTEYLAVANQAPDFGIGEPLRVVTTVTTAMATAGSSVEMRLVASVDPTVVTPTWTNHASTTTGLNFTSAYAAGVTTFTKTAHGLHTGHLVTAFANSATLPGNLTAITYVVIRVDENTFRVASSLALALAGTSVTTTSAGSGSFQLLPVPQVLASTGAINQLHMQVGAQIQLIAQPTPVLPGLSNAHLPLQPNLHMVFIASGSPTNAEWTSRVVKDAHGLKYHATGITVT